MIPSTTVKTYHFTCALCGHTDSMTLEQVQALLEEDKLRWHCVDQIRIYVPTFEGCGGGFEGWSKLDKEHQAFKDWIICTDCAGPALLLANELNAAREKGGP